MSFSLSTNIPPEETIDIAIHLIFNHNPNLNITRKELKRVFLFAISHNHFIFNSKFYNQIDGVAMGSPLAPPLNFLNNRHPNIKFTIEKQNNHSIAFLDVFISGINNQNLTLQKYQINLYPTFLRVLHHFQTKLV